MLNDHCALVAVCFSSAVLWQSALRQCCIILFVGRCGACSPNRFLSKRSRCSQPAFNAYRACQLSPQQWATNCQVNTHNSLQDAFGEQPITALLQQQGLDSQLQQSLLYGVLLDEGSSSTGSGHPSTSGEGGGSGGPAPVTAGQQQPVQRQQGMTAAEGLERLRLFVQSAGRYGPDTGGCWEQRT